MPDHNTACPPNSKVISSSESRPLLGCPTIVHHRHLAHHIWLTAIEILTSTTLPKPERLLFELAPWPWLLLDYNHSVTCIKSPVLEDHACPATLLKELKFQRMGHRLETLVRLSCAHAMHAIIVDGIAIINP